MVDGEVSNWKKKFSVVPQRSVLGPVLLLIYINDLEEGVTSKILKFTDDTNKEQLQDDIDGSSGQKNGRCYSILKNVNAYTQGLETMG